MTIIKQVELHEFEALQGCIETIKKYKPVIIIENHINIEFREFCVINMLNIF